MNEIERLVELDKIHTLLSTYTLTIDGEDPVGWAACFSEHGRFESGNLAIVGRPKLQRYAEIHNKAVGSRHITASPVYDITGGGSSARGKSTTVVSAATKVGYKTFFAGWYEDELVRMNGQWLIDCRKAFITGVAEEPDYPILTSDPVLAPLAQPLLDAWVELGEPIAT